MFVHEGWQQPMGFPLVIIGWPINCKVAEVYKYKDVLTPDCVYKCVKPSAVITLPGLENMERKVLTGRYFGNQV